MVQARSSLQTLKHKVKKCKVGERDTIQYIESLKIVLCVDVAVFFKNKNKKDYLPNDILTSLIENCHLFGIFCECYTDVLVLVSFRFMTCWICFSLLGVVRSTSLPRQETK